MHLWEFVKIGIFLSFVLIGIITFAAGFLVLNGDVGTVGNMTSLNRSAQSEIIIAGVTDAVGETTTTGTGADAVTNPVGAFVGVWEIIWGSPAVIAGFVTDVSDTLSLPSWFVGLITVIVSAIVVMELLGLLFRRDILTRKRE